MTKTAALKKTDLQSFPCPIVAMTAASQLHYAAEAPPELALQVRKSDDSKGLDDLEASVRAHGVIVPLVVVSHNGAFYVSAGNRRLKVVRRIYGDIDVHLPTVSSADFRGDPREIAMATNVSLPPHPVDRYEVIASLVKEGMTPADAQLRFGMTPRYFAQVMRLGSLSPTIRDHYRAGRIDGKTAQAFTLSSDPKEQDRVYSSIAKDAYKGLVSAHAVTGNLVGPKQRDVGRFVAFVGVEACRKAKILKQEDLFANNHTVTDVKALKKMADIKLQAKCEELRKAGWAWACGEDNAPGNKWAYSLLSKGDAKPTPAETIALAQLEHECHQLEHAESAGESNEELSSELSAEREKIREGIENRRYTDAQRAKAGCFIRINDDGSLTVEHGRVKPEDAKKVAASERPKAAAKKKAAAKSGEASITQALAGRMTENLQKAVAAVLMREPAIAAAAIIAACASDGATLDIKVGGGSHKKPASFESVFAGAVQSGSAELLMMLAQVAGHALDITSSDPDKMPLDDKGTAALLNALPATELNKAIRENFDATDYFNGVSMAAIVEIVRITVAGDHWSRVAKMSKADAVKFASAYIPETRWLPKHLRTAHYDGPPESVVEGKKPAPAKKAKPTKKPMAKKAAKR